MMQLLKRNLIAAMETIKATNIPSKRMKISYPVKSKPNFTIFNKLAPNITGIDK
jgi:hypothetical protein